METQRARGGRPRQEGGKRSAAQARRWREGGLPVGRRALETEAPRTTSERAEEAGGEALHPVGFGELEAEEGASSAAVGDGGKGGGGGS